MTLNNDWTGMASAAERRKLQNRLNQRACRKRKVIQDLDNGVVRRPRGRPRKMDRGENPSSGNHEATTSTCDGEDEASSSTASLVVASPRQHRASRRVIRPGETFFICEADPPETLKLVNRLASEVHHGMQQGPYGRPASDMLLSLTQFNVLRAMLLNMTALNLSVDEMKDDIVSPFNRAGYHDEDATHLPPTLRPTTLQKSITHHPWIDPFPLPSFRDTLLLADGSYNDLELCNDLVGQCGERNTGQVGIVVWGEPWDPYGWEMTESFARKWLWLFKGCKELLESTNYWRAQRGEERLCEI